MAPAIRGGTAVKLLLAVAVFLAILLMPAPAGLTEPGQRALAVMLLAVILWATEAIPVPVAGVGGVVLLVLIGAVPELGPALYGFSQPVAYFLIGILTLGLAVHRSGLAERMAIYLMRGAAGSPRLLYVQMLFSFAALTFALPSASTRGAIMVHVYERVLEHWDIPQEHPLYKATMMAMGSLNRLGSTALLAGGITPVVASGLLGDFSWTQWFLLMSVPFYANLIRRRDCPVCVLPVRIPVGRRRRRPSRVAGPNQPGGAAGRGHRYGDRPAVVHRFRPRVAPGGARHDRHVPDPAAAGRHPHLERI